MSDLIAGIGKIMQTEVNALSQIAQNATNVNTPGYKSGRVVVDSARFDSIFTSPSVEASRAYALDLSVGGVSQTGVATDLALANAGWFVVQMDGDLRLTRNGSFQLSQRGELTTSDGYQVMAVGEKPIDLSTAEYQVTGKGEVVVDEAVVAQLLIADPSGMTSLRPIGGGLFSFEGGITAHEDPRVLQGALEASNVDTSSEMVRLIERTRYIETLQRAISSLDELVNIGVSQIGQ